jgi:hypothetical protein
VNVHFAPTAALRVDTVRHPDLTVTCTRPLHPTARRKRIDRRSRQLAGECGNAGPSNPA